MSNKFFFESCGSFQILPHNIVANWKYYEICMHPHIHPKERMNEQCVLTLNDSLTVKLIGCLNIFNCYLNIF